MKNKKVSVISFILALVMIIMLIPSAMAAGVPTVAKMVPAEGTKNVQTVGTTIQLVFTEELDQSKVEASGSIVINNGARILAVKMVGPKTVNVYISDLLSDTEYTLKVTPAVHSSKGVAAETVEKKFTTGAAQPYHQIPAGASDMSDPIWVKGYNDAGANGNAMKFIKDGDNDVLQFTTPWVDAPVRHPVAIEPGATYKARARVKSNQTQALRVVMVYSTTSAPTEWYRMGEKWDQQAPAGEWIEIDSTFTIPDDLDTSVRMPQIEITARVNKSIVLIDDFQFYEVNTDEPAPVMDPGSAVSDKIVTTIEDASSDVTTQKLEGLGIYTKGDYSEKMPVTREMFSKYMAKILNADGFRSTANFENYVDVDTDYDGHIGTMVSMNVLTANDKGELRPDDAITYSEVCRAFVVALGHQKVLESKTPITAASNLGIKNTTGLKASSDVTYRDLNGLLNSFLEAECLYDDFSDFKTGEVLETMLGIAKLKGIVEATSQTSLDNSNGIKEGYVTISGKTYRLIDTNVSELLGKSVTYYVKEIDDEMCVLFFGDIEKNNKILKLNAYDTMGYSNNEYTYLIEGKSSEKRAKIETDKIVIYNGRTTGNYQETDLCPEYGWIELIDNDRNGKYDVVKITDYDTYVVESYDTASEIIRDKYENKYVDLSDVIEVLVYKNGKVGKVGAIQNDNVVTVERSMDGKRVVLHVSANTIEGDVGSVETDDDRGTRYVSFYDIVHGDQVQKNIPCIKGYAGNSNITIGDGGIFYIDSFGQIAAFKKGTGSWIYGYIKKVRYSEGEFVSIKMFTENNTHETIDCAERVVIDSYRTKGYDDTFNVLASAGTSPTTVEPELIMYKANSDGLIKHIKTARDTTKTDDFRRVKDISSGLYVSGNNMIVVGESRLGVMHVDDDTMLLQIPSDENVDDTALYKFSPAKSSLIYKGTNYTVYNQSADRLTADLLVVKDKTVWNQDRRSQGVVTKIKTQMDENNEIITVITTTSATIRIKENSLIDVKNMTAADGTTGLTLQKGDYVGWRNRGDGYVHDMKIIFKGDAKRNLQSAATNGESIDMIKCHWGRVTAKEDGIVEITDANGEAYSFNAGKSTVYRVISDLGKVEKVTTGEISAAGGTQAAVFTDWDGAISCVVIYE